MCTQSLCVCVTVCSQSQVKGMTQMSVCAGAVRRADGLGGPRPLRPASRTAAAGTRSAGGGGEGEGRGRGAGWAQCEPGEVLDALVLMLMLGVFRVSLIMYLTNKVLVSR